MCHANENTIFPNTIKVYAEYPRMQMKNFLWLRLKSYIIYPLGGVERTKNRKQTIPSSLPFLFSCRHSLSQCNAAHGRVSAPRTLQAPPAPSPRAPPLRQAAG